MTAIFFLLIIAEISAQNTQNAEDTHWTELDKSLSKCQSLRLVTEIVHSLRQKISEGSPNQVKLIYIGSPRPQRVTSYQFRKDATYCPDINWRRVRSIANKQFRCSVPSCGHVVGVVLTGTFEYAKNEMLALYST